MARRTNLPAAAVERQPGDPCPMCGGAFIVDPQQHPETLIARKRENAAVPSVADRFAEHVRRKAAELGLLHRCIGCGYHDRFPPKEHAA